MKRSPISCDNINQLVQEYWSFLEQKSFQCSVALTGSPPDLKVDRGAELEFVSAVNAGGSVNFLPEV